MTTGEGAGICFTIGRRFTPRASQTVPRLGASRIGRVVDPSES